MRIITDPNRDGWMVVAEWFGQERVVFRGTLFGCITFRADA